MKNQILGLLGMGLVSRSRFGLMSDIHLKLNYDPTTSVSKKCGPANDEKFLQLDATQKALLGRLGCDAP